LKFGVFHLIWARPLDDEELRRLSEHARGLGAEVLEIAIGRDPLPFDPRAARRVFEDLNMEATLVTSLAPERDITSEDAAVRDAGRGFLERYVGYAAELGAKLLSGPLYGTVWQPGLLTADERARRWGRCVEGLSQLAARAQSHGVRLAVEPLSRFHTSFLNTTADGCRLVDEIAHPAVGLLLDTFQMNIEEKDLGQAIRLAGPRLYHLHASENDRGTPGTGHVDWAGVRQALRDVSYEGAVVIEAFNPDVPELAAFMKVWRRLEMDQDTLAREGLRFLKKHLA